MAYQSAHNTRVLLGDLALSGYLTQATPKWAADMLDTTTLADGQRTFISGVESGSATFTGFYDATTHTKLTAFSADTALTFAPRGFTFGNEVWFMNTLRSQFAPGAQVSGVVSFDLEAMGDGNIDFGYALHDLSAETSDSNSATRDDTAATANGAVGVLHVTALSGYTGFAVDIRHSTDNFAASDNSLIAFTSATGTTSEIKSATGTVRRYIRVVWTGTGSGSCTFAVGFARR